MSAVRPVIGYAGMTHLGLNSAVAAAEKGFRVVCFDPNPKLIGQLAAGVLPVVELALPELLKKNAESIEFTAAAAGLSRCDLVYVAPDVATDDTGRSDLTAIEGILAAVTPALKRDAATVILSQVPPGFTRAHAKQGQALYYQVETLIFGRAVERALHPERFIVGCADPAEPLPRAFLAFLESFGCQILPMRYESAELAKIAINCCLVASLSTANTLAELCEGIGAVWSEIVPALRLDRRIGPFSYLNAGLGIAGGNLERDLATVLRLSETIGSDAAVVKTWIANSAHRKDWALRTLHDTVLSRGRDPLIAVLGLAYKENTASTKNSPSFALIRHLGPFRLRVFDPVVPAVEAPHPNALTSTSALDACAGADALVVMTPWPAFRTLKPSDIAERLAGKIVIDPYAVLDGKACRDAGLIYRTLGSGAEEIH